MMEVTVDSSFVIAYAIFSYAPPSVLLFILVTFITLCSLAYCLFCCCCCMRICCGEEIKVKKNDTHNRKRIRNHID